jgi:hypothetical protein
MTATRLELKLAELKRVVGTFRCFDTVVSRTTEFVERCGPPSIPGGRTGRRSFVKPGNDGLHVFECRGQDDDRESHSSGNPYFSRNC